MKENLVLKAYEIAKERYAAIGVNTDEVLDKLQKVQISLHCWQTDDVVGFESGSALSAFILLYFWLAVRFFAVWLVPPLA